MVHFRYITSYENTLENWKYSFRKITEDRNDILDDNKNLLNYIVFSYEECFNYVEMLNKFLHITHYGRISIKYTDIVLDKICKYVQSHREYYKFGIFNENKIIEICEYLSYHNEYYIYGNLYEDIADYKNINDYKIILDLIFNFDYKKYILVYYNFGYNNKIDIF